MTDVNVLGAWVRRWTIRRLILTLLGLGAVLLLVVGWFLTRPGAPFGPIDTTWRRVRINHDLYVGLDPNYPPFTEWTPERIEGLEADLARAIGERLDAKTSILIMGYDGLYNALYTGEVDLLISGLQVDTEYQEWVHYTQPYYDAGPILISRADAPVQNISEMDGGTLAVELASSGDLAARRWQRRLHSLAIVRYLLPDEAMQAVQLGDVDAALIDTVSARLYLDTHPDLVMAPRTTVSEGYVIALRQASFRLIEAVEKALVDMIADGTLDAIIDRWL